jgi:hypothetical protein
MKNLIVIFLILLVTTVAFAQRGNYGWGNDNVKTISGTITDNQRPDVFLKGNDGNTYRVHMGPVWYWNQNNYGLTVADATIKGNVNVINGEYHIYPYTIEQGNTTMSFTDDNGIPKWTAGNGKGMRRGNCQGNGRGRGNCCCCRNK